MVVGARGPHHHQSPGRAGDSPAVTVLLTTADKWAPRGFARLFGGQRPTRCQRPASGGQPPLPAADRVSWGTEVGGR